MESSKFEPLKNARRKTDDSLIVERGKTDESFENYKGRAELETDQAVSTSRSEADNARLQRRFKADQENESKDETSGRRLLQKRNSEDSAIENERSKHDKAIEVERGKTERLLNRLISVERGITDQNLHGERAKTDFASEYAANLLNREQRAHSNTKTALTTREEFVAIVSHDLRNPIGTILASVDLLMEEPAIKSIGQDAHQWLAMIKRNAETSLRLISDLLDMERINEGKIHLQIDSCPIRELIDHTVESYSLLAKEKNITLEYSPSGFDRTIDCDKDRVAQVLSNLLSNALKFTPPGGTVTVAIEDIKGSLKVSIKDTGIGIPEYQKIRIFERFAQIGNKRRSGLGLGLYISKTLVESHQGKIWVNSAPGEGSEFCFTLGPCK